MEPSTFQEVKDWLRVAFELSANSNLYTAYLVTVNQADGGGNVQLHPNRYPDINANHTTTLDTDDINIDNRVVLPPDSARIEIETLERRFPNAIETARRRNLNQIYNLNGTRHEMGFVTSGVAYTYLEHALHELEIQGQIPILKLGLTHPVDTEIVRQFSAGVREIYVVEEKRPLLEKDIKAIVGDLYQTGAIDRHVQVWGKTIPKRFTWDSRIARTQSVHRYSTVDSTTSAEDADRLRLTIQGITWAGRRYAREKSTWLKVRFRVKKIELNRSIHMKLTFRPERRLFVRGVRIAILRASFWILPSNSWMPTT